MRVRSWNREDAPHWMQKCARFMRSFPQLIQRVPNKIMI